MSRPRSLLLRPHVQEPKSLGPTGQQRGLLLLQTHKLHSRMPMPLWRQLHQLLLLLSKWQQGRLRGWSTSWLLLLWTRAQARLQEQQAPSKKFSAYTSSLQQPLSSMDTLHQLLHLLLCLDL